MRVRTLIIGYALVLALLLFAKHGPAAAPHAEFRAMIDLTHPLNAGTPSFDESATPTYRTKTVATIAKNKYFARTISLPEHFGTHIDAPAHFAAGLWTVDQIPPDRLVGPLVVLDVRKKVSNNPDYLISVEDIAQWEQTNGQIPLGSIVIARTGWESRWNSAAHYRNADAHGAMHFPGFSLDAAKFLVEGRQIRGLGIDTLSVDYGPSQDFPVHEYVLAHSVYQLENVANLDQAPEKGALLVVAPMKLEGGSGGPARLLALER
jgi:kynurenine formamidase